jgi:peptidoglycan hydrolase-like protein with peptidoglycan-binding domain
MRIKRDLPAALYMSRGSVGPTKYGPDPVVPLRAIGSAPGRRVAFRQSTPVFGSGDASTAPTQPSELADKYALLLKYSDKARAAEERLNELPDDLRDRFKQEVVADPARIEDIVAALLAEARKRLSPFDDAELDALYQKLAAHGPDAQAEFKRVLELLKGQVDAAKVFAQISEDHLVREAQEKSRRSADRDLAAAPHEPETAEEMEERRRRAARIAREIEELRRTFESRSLATGSDTPKTAEGALPAPPTQTSHRAGEAGQPAAAAGDRAMALPVELPATVANPSQVTGDDAPRLGAELGAVSATPAIPATPQQDQSVAAGGSFARQRKWAPALTAAIVVIAAASGGAVKLTVPPLEIADAGHRRAVAELQRQAQQEAALREAAVKKAESEAAARKAAEAALAAEAMTRRHEEETRQAAARQREDEERTRIEAAREQAEAEARLAAEEAARRQEAEESARRQAAEDARRQVVEEARRKADEQAAKMAESRPRPEADVRQQAEKAEVALNLSDTERKRVQAALTALGHEVPATGYFGPITRAAITAWQKTQGLPATGFLDEAQLVSLNVRAVSSKGAEEQTKLDPQRAEAALNLSDAERKRIQAALTALGHEVPTTGYFGPVTRAAITAWQKTQGLPATGFLDASQFAALQAQAATVKRADEPTRLDPAQAEAALNLSDAERKRVQAALTALGHEVSATGYFGPVTRAAITAWQKTQGLPATGYLTDEQLTTLRQQAAAVAAK